ncbi:hypothetical protein GCM10009595_13900 [Falsarthrobacter nasiphocae]
MVGEADAAGAAEAMATAGAAQAAPLAMRRREMFCDMRVFPLVKWQKSKSARSEFLKNTGADLTVANFMVG